MKVSSISYIRRHIARLRSHELFVSRDFLPYGTRSAIDNALYLMVKTGEIVRLTSGVFMKRTHPRRKPSALAVAQVKAEAFGKQIFQHGADSAKDLALTERGNSHPTFLTTGHSTSFRFGKTRIYLKALACRKVLLNKLKVGKAINALLHLNYRTDTKVIALLFRNSGRFERDQLFRATKLMPGWLSNLCHFHRESLHRPVPTN